jgi:hypothetical protein
VLLETVPVHVSTLFLSPNDLVILIDVQRVQLDDSSSTLLSFSYTYKKDLITLLIYSMADDDECRI